jgi:hypothetical protein
MNIRIIAFAASAGLATVACLLAPAAAMAQGQAETPTSKDKVSAASRAGQASNPEVAPPQKPATAAGTGK